MTIFDNVNKFMDIKAGKKWYSLSAVIYILKEKKKQGKKKNLLRKEKEKCAALFHLLADNPLLHENQCSNYQIAPYKAP